MLKTIFRKLNVFFDSFKEVFLALFIFVSIIVLIASVIHNVLKIGEISSYQGNYRKLVQVLGNKMMNVYVAGRGEKTIVILPDFGYQSPVIQYKPIVDSLRENYRVVVIEYFGYGFSMGVDEERTNENIVSEIKKALEEVEVYDNYILMPHGTSNIYAMNYAKQYPDKVQAIVSIDGRYPGEINEINLENELNDFKNNIVANYVFEFTGIFRILSYVKPDFFNIDKMQEAGTYTYDDIKVYRNRIGSSYLTGTMIKEIRNLKTNMEELKDYRYDQNLPVLNILSTKNIEKYSEYKKDNLITKDINMIIDDIVTNSDIQKVVEINGDIAIELTNADEIVASVRTFVNSF